MLLIDIPAATLDSDLSSRVIAAAALAGEADPENWQWRHRYSVAAAPADPSGTPLVDVWVYARDGAKVDRPGLDPTVVTDDLIKAAVRHVRERSA